MLKKTILFVTTALVLISCKDKKVPEIEANFSADKQTVLIGKSVTFKDLSLNSPTTWIWSFEGGTPEVSFEKNPTIFYENAGQFNVGLIASNDDNEDTELRIKYIVVSEAVTTQFVISDTLISIGESINFSDASTGEPTQWEWIFEGGTPSSSTEQNPIIAYQTPGNYDVKLTTSNALSSFTVTKPNCIKVLDIISANFNASDSLIFTNGIVQFSNLSTGDPNTWSWFFEGGNPSSSSDQNPIVSYLSPGKFDVILTASNEINSDTKHEIETIEVYERLNAQFTSDKTVVFKNSEIIFTNTSTGTIKTLQWEFEGGNPISSNEQTPTVKYENEGTYTATLFVSNELETVSKTINIQVISAQDNLIAYYPFNGNANDESIYNHNGIINGPVLTTDRHGNINSAFLFDGINDYINVTRTNILDGIEDEISISAWVRPDNDNYYHGIISKGSANYMMDLAIHRHPGIFLTGLTFAPDNAQNYWGRILLNTTIPINQWSHLVATYKKSDQLIKFYINNVLVSQSYATGTINSGNQDLRIGSRITSNPLYKEFFYGAIDDIRVYDRAISQTEVDALFMENK